jgi:hypothetical protein
MAQEMLGITVHIGSLRSRILRDSLRWTLRAALLEQRRRLGKTTVERKPDSLTVKGKKFSMSMEHNGWIHFGFESVPTSPRNLALANLLGNEISTYLNGPLKRNSKLSISTNLSASVSISSLSWSSFFMLKRIQDFEKSLKVKLKPEGLFLIQREHSMMNSIILTLSGRKCKVTAFISRGIADQIPKDFVQEYYGIAKRILRQTTSVLS